VSGGREVLIYPTVEVDLAGSMSVTGVSCGVEHIETTGEKAGREKLRDLIEVD